MKMRLNNEIFGIAIAALGLALGCTEDSSTGSVGDGGLEAGATTGDDGEDSENEDPGPTDPTPTETDDDDTGPTAPTMMPTVPTTMPTMPAENCTEEPTIICDGKDRVLVDSCEMAGPEVLETCDGDCLNGLCVECPMTGGVICGNDGDVHQLDGCGNEAETIAECSNGCSNGACIAEECEPIADKACSGNLLFALDSCGNQTNIEDVCDAGCEDGACVGCTDDGDTLCYAGDVYPVDSCGRTGVVQEECAVSCSVTGEDTTAAVCSDVVCTPTENLACFSGDLYAVDSCGGILEGVVTDCHNGCDGAECSPCIAAPEGVMCFEGDVYDSLGGCDAPAVRSETVKEECAFGCFNGACAVEGQCVPQGTVCFDGDVHATDTCMQVGELVTACAVGCVDGACVGEGEGDGGMGGPDSGVDAGTALDSGIAPLDGGAADAGADAGSDAAAAVP